jgi:hypothetical protein
MVVTVLEEGGRTKSGWENASDWSENYCALNKAEEEAQLVGTSTEDWDTAPIANQHVHLQY